MNRATLVALCTGTVITSAAAIGVGTAGETPAPTMTRAQHAAALARIAAAREAARAAQVARIEVRHQAALAGCAPLKGYDQDDCLIRVHAVYGRALLESQAPYSMRND